MGGILLVDDHVNRDIVDHSLEYNIHILSIVLNISTTAIRYIVVLVLYEYIAVSSFLIRYYMSHALEGKLARSRQKCLYLGVFYAKPAKYIYERHHYISMEGFRLLA